MIAEPPARILLRNAHCFRAGRREPCDLLILGERYEAVGPPCSVAAPPGTPTQDLGFQGLVVSGFLDVHAHPAAWGLSLSRLRLDDARSLEDALERVRAALENLQTEALIAEGFDETRWPSPTLPTRRHLDRLSKTVPIVLRRICGHLAVANSAALQRIPPRTRGVNRSTGHLVEEPSLNLDRYFPPTLEDLKLGILMAQSRLLKMGITGITDFGKPLKFRAYQELARSGALLLRVTFYLYAPYLDALEELQIQSGLGDARLRLGGLKLFLDGSVGAGTAAFPHFPRARLPYSLSALKRLLRRAQDLGLQVAMHAIGPLAIERALLALRQTLAGGNTYRHRLEHFAFPTEEHLRWAARLGILVATQPNFVRRWGRPGGLYHQKVGDEWFRRGFPFRRMLDTGLRVAFSSDGMPYGPLYGLKGALEHPVPEERLDLATALDLYLRSGAYFSFEEHEKGDLQPGYLADPVLLVPDPFEVDDLDRVEAFPLLVNPEPPDPLRQVF